MLVIHNTVFCLFLYWLCFQYTGIYILNHFSLDDPLKGKSCSYIPQITYVMKGLKKKKRGGAFAWYCLHSECPVGKLLVFLPLLPSMHFTWSHNCKAHRGRYTEVKLNPFFVLQHLGSDSFKVFQHEHSLQNNATCTKWCTVCTSYTVSRDRKLC